MDEMEYERIAEVIGRGHADVVQSLLDAQSISVYLVQDSVSQSTYVSPLAVVQVLVPRRFAKLARELIRGLEGVIETEQGE
jgi:hypothetical protein